MANKSKKYVYGRDPSPTNWHETADILRDQKKPKKSSKPSRLDEIHKMLKDQKGSKYDG